MKFDVFEVFLLQYIEGIEIELFHFTDNTIHNQNRNLNFHFRIFIVYIYI